MDNAEIVTIVVVAMWLVIMVWDLVSEHKLSVRCKKIGMTEKELQRVAKLYENDKEIIRKIIVQMQGPIQNYVTEEENIINDDESQKEYIVLNMIKFAKLTKEELYKSGIADIVSELADILQGEIDDAKVTSLVEEAVKNIREIEKLLHMEVDAKEKFELREVCKKVGLTFD